MEIEELFATIQERLHASPEESYTARLAAEGEDEVIKKVGEEAIEVVLAAGRQGDQRLVSELADLTYHILVLLAVRGLTPADILTELENRRR
ncbi:MAG: phosphoribosyl-ATP diphosphatase [Anaerolineaceae bacterium]|nr:phosphoribosyl-ATP diphosphatase [Anaerolineaceae bacterium]